MRRIVLCSENDFSTGYFSLVLSFVFHFPISSYYAYDLYTNGNEFVLIKSIANTESDHVFGRYFFFMDVFVRKRDKKRDTEKTKINKNKKKKRKIVKRNQD